MMAIFQNYHIPLISWDEAFKDYIVSNYDSICEYVKGDPPEERCESDHTRTTQLTACLDMGSSNSV